MCREGVNIHTDHKPLEIIFKKPILAAPKRLQKMLLKLQRYQLNVTHKTGSLMFIADMPSRIKSPETSSKQLEHYDRFYTRLEKMIFTDYMGLSAKTLAATAGVREDHVLQSLKTTVLTGWPVQKDQVPVNIQDYWNFRDEIGV